jgi:putative ABC transport system permease protein
VLRETLALAAVGVYGVLAYTVAQSRHEIGVRMALGQPRQHILKLFLGHGIKWAALGGSAGLEAAFILVRFMRSMLFEVGPYDLTVFLSVTVVLGVVVLMARYFPAIRAISVDPMVALRYEQDFMSLLRSIIAWSVHIINDRRKVDPDQV